MRDELDQRVAWLERKMVRVLWWAISAVSMLFGWLVGNVVIGEYGWKWAVVFAVTCFATAFIAKYFEFKGAPDHIELIDP